MANPVIGTMPCPDCDETVTVHQVAKGKGKRLMFYTHCPECGCDQRMGANRQEHIFNNTIPRDGFESVFEGQKPPTINRDDGQDEKEQESSVAAVPSGQDDGQTGGKMGLVIFGLVVTGILTAAGLRR